MLLDVGLEIQAMLTYKLLRLIGVSALERLNNVHVVDKRLVRPITVSDCLNPDRALVDKQVLGDPRFQFSPVELGKHPAERRDFLVGCV